MMQGNSWRIAINIFFQRMIPILSTVAALMGLEARGVGPEDLNGLDYNRLMQNASKFTNFDADSGACWSFGKDWICGVHPPWKSNRTGLVILDFKPDIDSEKTTFFEAKISGSGKNGSDGVEVALLAVVEGKLFLLKLLEIDASDQNKRLSVELTPWIAKKANFWLVIGPRKNPWVDNTKIAELGIYCNNKPAWGGAEFQTQGKTIVLPFSPVEQQMLEQKRHPDTSIIDWHLRGRRHGINIYSSRDIYRPLFGAHIDLSQNNMEKGLNAVRDMLDFGAGRRVLQWQETMGIPGVLVYQCRIPLGNWDHERWKSSEGAGYNLVEYASKYKFLLGATTSSEPHISPDFRYTGHNRKEVESMPWTRESSLDFGLWLAGLYNDDTPREDSNRDGRTFAGDFGFDADHWNELGLKMPKGDPRGAFLRSAFFENVIAATIAGVDSNYHKNQSVLPITSRLLSSAMTNPSFSVSLRQLRLPAESVGVTFYPMQANHSDPQQAQAVFGRERIYQSEKTFSGSLLLRPPWHQNSGRCIGVFGPYEKFTLFRGTLVPGFNNLKGRLWVKVEQTAANDPLTSPVLVSQEWEISADKPTDFSLTLKYTAQPWFLRISCRNEKDSLTSLHKVYIRNPVLCRENIQYQLSEDYLKGKLYTTLDTSPDKAMSLGHSLKTFDAAATEFKGGYLYQISQATGKRIVYNEFQTGNPEGNTPGNVYRGVFHQLQFKPAVINWFNYAAGDTKQEFTAWDIYGISTELAVIRSQLELLRPYPEIERGQRPLGVFIPIATPVLPETEIGLALKNALPKQLEKFGPDILLNDQLDQYHRYDNIILVLGYLTGDTDQFLQQFLQRIPEGKKVLVLCAGNSLYCEPGMRGSKRFDRSLEEVLPLFPEVTGFTEVQLKDGVNTPLELHTAKMVTLNPRFRGGRILKVANQVVGWRSDNLMMLAGYPTKGLEPLIEEFFGLPVPAMREAGKLKILNRSITAQVEGYYCVAAGQELEIGKGFIAYDLVSRKPVNDHIAGEAVVLVLSQAGFAVFDAGTAVIQLQEKTLDRVEVRARRPKYRFEGNGVPEFIMASPVVPVVTCNGKELIVEPIAGAINFYRVAVEVDGVYEFRRM